MMKTVYLYVLDTMADWETGYILQGLSMQNMLLEPKFQLKTVGAGTAPIKTLGGVTMIPDCALEDVQEEETAALLLPGADNWAAPEHRAVLELSAALLGRGVLVAAICGATLALADLGLLNDRLHTSNAPYFLSGLSKNYGGGHLYREELAVADGNLITAGSAGGLLWARKILESLDLYRTETLEAWHRYYQTGDAAYYMQLLETFPKR